MSNRFTTEQERDISFHANSFVYAMRMLKWTAWNDTDICKMCKCKDLSTSFEIWWIDGKGPFSNGMKYHYCSEMCLECLRKLIPRDTARTQKDKKTLLSNFQEKGCWAGDGIFF